MTILKAATLAGFIAMSAAAAEPSRPMAYDDGVFCQSIFQLTLEEKPATGRPPSKYSKHQASTLYVYARAAALRLGRAAGKTDKQISVDFEESVDGVGGVKSDGGLSDGKLAGLQRSCERTLDADAHRND